MTIGQKLAKKRRRAGLTQDVVSEALGVTPQAISKWENDVSCPDITLLPKIAAVYSTTVDDLLSGDPATEVALIREEARKDIGDMVMHIIVDSSDGDKVRVNLPMALVCAFVESGAPMGDIMNIGSFNLGSIDLKTVLSMIHSGVIGRLIEVESADGDFVIIEVD